MVDIPKLQDLQATAVKLAKALGYSYVELDKTELTRFGKAYERAFVLGYPEREIVDVYLRHQGEALLGAMVAKEQMDAVIDGEQPGSGKVGGPLPIRACWLGIGDDWEDIASIYGSAVARGQGYWTPGAPQDWIHSGTLLMGGADSHPVKIAENALHVVFGVGSLHASPKIESVQFEINEKTKPIFLTFFAQKQAFGRRWKEFDNAYVWKKDDTILADVLISEAFGETISRATDYPYLIGVSYIKEPQLRIFDPVTGTGRILPGRTHNVILTT